MARSTTNPHEVIITATEYGKLLFECDDLREELAKLKAERDEVDLRAESEGYEEGSRGHSEKEWAGFSEKRQLEIMLSRYKRWEGEAREQRGDAEVERNEAREKLVEVNEAGAAMKAQRDEALDTGTQARARLAAIHLSLYPWATSSEHPVDIEEAIIALRTERTQIFEERYEALKRVEALEGEKVEFIRLLSKANLDREEAAAKLDKGAVITDLHEQLAAALEQVEYLKRPFAIVPVEGESRRKLRRKIAKLGKELATAWADNSEWVAREGVVRVELGAAKAELDLANRQCIQHDATKDIVRNERDEALMELDAVTEQRDEACKKLAVAEAERDELRKECRTHVAVHDTAARKLAERVRQLRPWSIGSHGNIPRAIDALKAELKAERNEPRIELAELREKLTAAEAERDGALDRANTPSAWRDLFEASHAELGKVKAQLLQALAKRADDDAAMLEAKAFGDKATVGWSVALAEVRELKQTVFTRDEEAKGMRKLLATAEDGVECSIGRVAERDGEIARLRAEIAELHARQKESECESQCHYFPVGCGIATSPLHAKRHEALTQRADAWAAQAKAESERDELETELGVANQQYASLHESDIQRREEVAALRFELDTLQAAPQQRDD